MQPYLGVNEPFSWAGSFTDEVVRSSSSLGKAAKPFIKALVNPFGERNPEGEPVRDAKGHLVPNSDLTDYENVPLIESIHDYVAREALPHLANSYIDETFRDDRNKEIDHGATKSISIASSTIICRTAS